MSMKLMIAPRAVDTIVTQEPDSASAAIDESEETTTETQEETEDTCQQVLSKLNCTNWPTERS